jgi:hypothetical protein
MKRATSRNPREAMGCFLMLIFGAILCVCLMRIALIAIGQRGRAGHFSWWQLDVLLALVPCAGIVLTAWLTYGFEGALGLVKRKRK